MSLDDKGLLELPRALREEREAVLAAARMAWERARFANMNAREYESLKEARRHEVAEELRGGLWGWALREAERGDASRLALLLTRGRVPPELADLVYAFIIAAPWRDRRRGARRRLNVIDSIGVKLMMIAEYKLNGRRRDEVIDELAMRYRVSRATIERALAEP